MSWKKLSHYAWVKHVPMRSYAWYGKDTVPPIFIKDKLDEKIEKNELDNYKHKKFQAARGCERYSIFSDVTILKFTNYVMKKGQKNVARDQVEKTLTRIKEIQVSKYNRETDPEIKSNIVIDPLRVFKQAVQNCRPVMKLCEIKRGGQIYQVPGPITETESMFRAMRWLVLGANERDSAIEFHIQLSNDILDAFESKGRTVKKKIEIHKTCETNRAYAHYRFG